jgi:GDPmannose 4,6-dehydratase
MKKPLITGITGRDGSYPAELLLSNGYQVHSIVRRASAFNTERIEHIYGEPQSDTSLHLHYGDLAGAARLRQILEFVQPDEVYNLGAQSRQTLIVGGHKVVHRSEVAYA